MNANLRIRLVGAVIGALVGCTLLAAFSILRDVPPIEIHMPRWRVEQQVSMHVASELFVDEHGRLQVKTQPLDMQPAETYERLAVQFYASGKADEAFGIVDSIWSPRKKAQVLLLLANHARTVAPHSQLLDPESPIRQAANHVEYAAAPGIEDVEPAAADDAWLAEEARVIERCREHLRELYVRATQLTSIHEKAEVFRVLADNQWWVADFEASEESLRSAHDAFAAAERWDYWQSWFALVWPPLFVIASGVLSSIVAPVFVAVAVVLAMPYAERLKKRAPLEVHSERAKVPADA